MNIVIIVLLLLNVLLSSFIVIDIIDEAMRSDLDFTNPHPDHTDWTLQQRQHHQGHDDQ